MLSKNYLVQVRICQDLYQGSLMSYLKHISELTDRKSVVIKRENNDKIIN